MTTPEIKKNVEKFGNGFFDLFQFESEPKENTKTKRQLDILRRPDSYDYQASPKGPISLSRNNKIVPSLLAAPPSDNDFKNVSFGQEQILSYGRINVLGNLPPREKLKTLLIMDLTEKTGGFHTKESQARVNQLDRDLRILEDSSVTGNDPIRDQAFQRLRDTLSILGTTASLAGGAVGAFGGGVLGSSLGPAGTATGATAGFVAFSSAIQKGSEKALEVVTPLENVLKDLQRDDVQISAQDALYNLYKAVDSPFFGVGLEEKLNNQLQMTTHTKELFDKTVLMPNGVSREYFKEFVSEEDIKNYEEKTGMSVNRQGNGFFIDISYSRDALFKKAKENNQKLMEALPKVSQEEGFFKKQNKKIPNSTQRDQNEITNSYSKEEAAFNIYSQASAEQKESFVNDLVADKNISPDVKTVVINRILKADPKNEKALDAAAKIKNQKQTKDYAFNEKLNSFNQGLNFATLLLSKIDPKTANVLSVAGTSMTKAVQLINDYISFGNFFNLASGIGGIIAGLLSLFGGGKSSQELILEELGNIKKMIRNLSEQMHDRFDRVDRRLVSLSDMIENVYLNLRQHQAVAISDIYMARVEIAQLQASLDKLGIKMENSIRDLYQDKFDSMANQCLASDVRNVEYTEFKECLNVFETFTANSSKRDIYTSALIEKDLFKAEMIENPYLMGFLLKNFINHISSTYNITPSMHGVANPAIWASGVDALIQLLYKFPEHTKKLFSKDKSAVPFINKIEVGGLTFQNISHSLRSARLQDSAADPEKSTEKYSLFELKMKEYDKALRSLYSETLLASDYFLNDEISVEGRAQKYMNPAAIGKKITLTNIEAAKTENDFYELSSRTFIDNSNQTKHKALVGDTDVPVAYYKTIPAIYRLAEALDLGKVTFSIKEEFIGQPFKIVSKKGGCTQQIKDKKFVYACGNPSPPPFGTKHYTVWELAHPSGYEETWAVESNGVTGASAVIAVENNIKERTSQPWGTVALHYFVNFETVDPKTSRPVVLHIKRGLIQEKISKDTKRENILSREDIYLNDKKFKDDEDAQKKYEEEVQKNRDHLTELLRKGFKDLEKHKTGCLDCNEATTKVTDLVNKRIQEIRDAFKYNLLTAVEGKEKVSAQFNKIAIHINLLTKIKADLLLLFKLAMPLTAEKDSELLAYLSDEFGLPGREQWAQTIPQFVESEVTLANQVQWFKDHPDMTKIIHSDGDWNSIQPLLNRFRNLARWIDKETKRWDKQENQPSPEVLPFIEERLEILNSIKEVFEKK